MSEKAKQIVFTDNDKAIVKVLKEAGKGLTLKEINEKIEGKTITAGSMTSAVNKGLIAVADKVGVARKTKKHVFTFSYGTDEVLKNEKGNAFEYTDAQNKVIAFLKTNKGDFTLAEIGEKLGEKIYSGTMNALVKKGNVIRSAEKKEIEVITENAGEVNVYVYVKDAE